MTPAELRPLVANAEIFKMSLGKTASYRKEAMDKGVLVFGSEKAFHEAVLSSDEAAIARAGALVKSDRYVRGGAKENAYGVWRGSIVTFRTLPRDALIVHWEADADFLHWGITTGDFSLAREETGNWGQPGLVFHRPLLGGWRKISVNGMPLSNLHPKARDVAVNMATLNRVQTHPDYLRTLILGGDTTPWESRPDWQEKAREVGWKPKDYVAIRAGRPDPTASPLVQEAADYFEAEVRRMAGTALHTAAYANGQTVMTVVKAKDIGFARAELEEEIAALLVQQKHRCALSGYAFKPAVTNPHLRPSLDRKDSALGYVPGNLQIVTRAANFFKSASNEADWALKAAAMEHMAIAMQQRRKEAKPV
jgi:hypothetical protein